MWPVIKKSSFCGICSSPNDSNKSFRVSSAVLWTLFLIPLIVSKTSWAHPVASYKRKKQTNIGKNIFIFDSQLKQWCTSGWVWAVWSTNIRNFFLSLIFLATKAKLWAAKSLTWSLFFSSRRGASSSMTLSKSLALRKIIFNL